MTASMPLAWLTSRTDLPGRAFWGIAAALPLVIPSYIGAVVTVAAFGPRGLLQSILAPLGVERLPSLYGFTGSWLTLTLFTYPYVYLTVRAALRVDDITDNHIPFATDELDAIVEHTATATNAILSSC